MLIDNIPQIQQWLDDNEVNHITVVLTGIAVADRWPRICISINDKIKYTGSIEGKQTLRFDNLHITDHLRVQIEFSGKQENDTVIEHNKIVANQHVRIEKLQIDDLSVQGVELANLSSTNYDLTTGQQAAYNINNFPWTDVKTDTLWDNGIWQINLKTPILTTLLKSKIYPKQVFELDHGEVLTRLQLILESDHRVV